MDSEFLKDFVEIKAASAFQLERSSALFLISEEKVVLIQTDENFAGNFLCAKSGSKNSRPLTFELFANFCRAFEITPKIVLISEYSDEIFYAKIVYSMKNELGEKLVEIDARPSDALLQAALFRTEIFVSRKVLAAVKDASKLLELAKKREREILF